MQVNVPLTGDEIHNSRIEIFHGNLHTPIVRSSVSPGCTECFVTLPEGVDPKDCLVTVTHIDSSGEKIGLPFKVHQGELVPYNPKLVAEVKTSEQVPQISTIELEHSSQSSLVKKENNHDKARHGKDKKTREIQTKETEKVKGEKNSRQKNTQGKEIKE